MRLERDENSNQRLQWKCLRHGERSCASVKVLRTVKVAAQRLKPRSGGESTYGAVKEAAQRLKLFRNGEGQPMAVR